MNRFVQRSPKKAKAIIDKRISFSFIVVGVLLLVSIGAFGPMGCAPDPLETKKAPPVVEKKPAAPKTDEEREEVVLQKLSLLIELFLLGQ